MLSLSLIFHASRQILKSVIFRRQKRGRKKRKYMWTDFHQKWSVTTSTNPSFLIFSLWQEWSKRTKITPCMHTTHTHPTNDTSFSFFLLLLIIIECHSITGEHEKIWGKKTARLNCVRGREKERERGKGKKWKTFGDDDDRFVHFLSLLLFNRFPLVSLNGVKQQQNDRDWRALEKKWRRRRRKPIDFGIAIS